MIYGLLTLNPHGGLLPNGTMSVWRQSPFEYDTDEIMFVLPVAHRPEDLMMLPRGTCGHISHPVTQLVIDRATRRRRLISPSSREWGYINILTPKVSIIRIPLMPMKLGNGK